MFQHVIKTKMVIWHFLNKRFHKWSFYVLLIWSFFIKKKKEVFYVLLLYLLIKNGRVNFQKCSLSHEVFDRLDATNQ